MSAHAQRLRLRCFLEGVEIPIVSAQVSSSPNSPVVASLQVPPLAEGTRLLPRTLVHVFFLDFQAAEFANTYRTEQPPKTDVPASKYPPYPPPTEKEQTREDYDSDLRSQHYKLLFVGEVVGFQWSKGSASRSLVLQCVDPSNYWDYAYQFNNTDIFGPGMKAMFSGGSTNLFTDFLTDEGSVILQLLRKKPRGYPHMKGLLAGIVSVLEGIGGSYFGPKKIAGQNSFFSLAELRLHISQMITAYDKDPTSHNLVNADGYDGLFGRTLGGLGSQVSFRQAVNALQGMIFHESFGQPCPKYVPGTWNSTSGQDRRNIQDIPEAKFIIEAAEIIRNSCTAMLEQLQEAAVGNYENKTKADTKKFILTFPAHAAKFCTQTLNTLAGIGSPILNTTKTYFITARGHFQKATTTLQTKWGGGLMDEQVYAAVREQIGKASAQMTRALGMQLMVSRPGEGVPARLHQQIFRPDVWFTPPPRCNVIFPDQYTSMNYSRSFLAEPTRFLLKTNDEFFGEDELFDNFFFAPKSIVANAKDAKKADPTLQKLLSNGVLDHELFTGIMPVFEKMGELNIFAAQSGLENGKHLKVGLAQRSTNFLYFKYRFAARQMSLQCRFNPYVACGFPGLIIDKYVDPSIIERHNGMIQELGPNHRLLNTILGTHFLGNFTEVSHSVSQGEGSTSINVGYARQSEESAEFLGTVGKEQTVKKRFDKDATRRTIVAAVTPPPVGAIGPNYGVITSVLDVTFSYLATGLKEGPFFQFYSGPRRKPGETRVMVPCGITATTEEYGPDLVEFFGNTTQPLMFRAFEVLEEVPRYRSEKIDLPAEEYIRPGWYGPCWKPNKISEAYDFFFGVGAITEKSVISDAEGGSKAGGIFPVADALKESLSQDNPFVGGKDGVVSVLTLDEDATIQQAVQFLVLTYSYARQASSVNIEDFIRAYTWRPIASMLDIFGTSNLVLSTDGTQVVSGHEGFHSRAFGPYEDLFGLTTPEVETILGFSRGEAATQRMDTRKRKQSAVLDYVTALQFSRAILG